MLFDINDFDETLPGPWEWDVKRLAASFEIMGRDRGFSPDDRRSVVMAGVREYRGRMRRAAGMGSLDAWYEHFEVGTLLKGEIFDRAMADFSAAYADQNERDYAAFAAAVDSGRLAARTGV